MSVPHRSPADNARAQRNIRAKKKLLIDAHKSEQGCEDCEERDPVVLDLHHLDPASKHPALRRSGGGSHTWQGRLSFEAIVAEFAKCIVLCANCHRRRHGS